jgi:hypothetical protein
MFWQRKQALFFLAIIFDSFEQESQASSENRY